MNDALRRLDRMERASDLKYSPDQPRDEHGRFGEGGGVSAERGAPAHSSLAIRQEHVVGRGAYAPIRGEPTVHDVRLAGRGDGSRTRLVTIAHGNERAGHRARTLRPRA